MGAEAPLYSLLHREDVGLGGGEEQCEWGGCSEFFPIYKIF